MDHAERIAILRRRCLTRAKGAQNMSPLTASLLKASEDEPSWRLRRGRLTRDRLCAMRFEIDECELLGGRVAMPVSSPDQLEQARQYLGRYVGPEGQTGHCELDRREIFASGIAGLRERIAALHRQASGEQAQTYRTFLLALEGLMGMIRNVAAAARSAAANASPERQVQVARIERACEHLAEQAPRDFFEAIQLVWLMDLAVMFGEDVSLVVPGRIDRTLWPFYQRDLAAGEISRDEALVLIESLYLLVNSYIPDGLAMSVMVGGRDAAGRDVTNDLSYLCLEAIRRTRLIYPTVGVCWHEGTPENLVDLAVEMIAQGCPTPAFFNDQTIQKGLVALGVPPEHAGNYINSTCVEITPVASSNVWVASPYFNLCGLLLEELADQASGNPAESFEAFLGSYYRRLTAQIEREAAVQNRCRRQRAQVGGKPLQSVFTRDCIARGLDIDDGGAIYNWVECSFVGLANLADSLQAIRTEVYERCSLGLAQLKAALDADFAGQEPLRLRLLNEHPKYGNGCEEVDALVARTVAFCQAQCAAQRMAPDDSRFVPGSFCWIMHEVFGRQTGATPDGRKAGFPFADGGGPAQGRERLGPTAAILSTTSWDHSPMIGGLAYNMKFNSSLLDSPRSRRGLRDLIVTYLRRGGFETQVNVVDRRKLLQAREHPEQHRDLAVRIGGYVDYFTRLSPQMQDEVLLRTEFEKI